MSKSRKTFSVAELTENVNRRNRLSTCPKEMRVGWNSLLEEVLGATGNYMGFTFLTQSEVPDDCKPGIESEGDMPEFPDETRVSYIIVSSLLT